ncbi:MAG: CYTH domain-containing protein [Bacteroidaceae bacterium]|nr:CYTH domain-containing protein [Bacteroidaceae bacterium]
MALEIERKFLVGGGWKERAVSSTYIVQGYICSQSGRTVRIRLRDEKSYLTIKGPARNGGLARYEFEKEVTRDEALSLLAICEPGVVEKRRWLVPVGDHTVEVDEFFGDNAGLVFAEVELRSEDDTFERPPFLGKEVTGQRRYYNSCLRTHPYKDWTDEERNP